MKTLLIITCLLLTGCTYVTINNSIVTCEDINVDKTQDIKPVVDVTALP